MRFDAVEETQGLLPQLTLGADNGLRGYDAHLLTGTQRLLANGEHRFDTGIEVWVLRLGLCAFVDAGWVGDSLDLGRPYLGAGGGLRLGCPELLGAPVLRADFAGLELLRCEELERDVQEGEWHRGKSAVVQLLARR